MWRRTQELKGCEPKSGVLASVARSLINLLKARTMIKNNSPTLILRRILRAKKPVVARQKSF